MSTAANTSAPASWNENANASYTNGHHHSHHHHDLGPAGKKGKQKKASDPNEDAKMIQAKIAQLEMDATTEKDQEAEIGSFTLCCTISGRSLGEIGRVRSMHGGTRHANIFTLD